MPEYLLLDEPLTAVDEASRGALGDWVLSLLEEKPIPTILVTHDGAEAKRFGRKIIQWKDEVNLCLEF